MVQGILPPYLRHHSPHLGSVLCQWTLRGCSSTEGLRVGVLIRPRPALHANVKSKRVTTPALGPESMFSNFSLASHVEINLCSSQGHAFWESLVQSNGPESLDQSHWSPFSTCRIEGAGSWELCKRLLCSALPGHLPVMQSCCPWSRWARGKHRPSTDLSLPRRRLVNITVDSHTHTPYRDRPWMHPPCPHRTHTGGS